MFVHNPAHSTGKYIALQCWMPLENTQAEATNSRAGTGDLHLTWISSRRCQKLRLQGSKVMFSNLRKVKSDLEISFDLSFPGCLASENTKDEA